MGRRPSRRDVRRGVRRGVREGVRGAAGVGALLLAAVLTSCGGDGREPSPAPATRAEGDVPALLLSPEALGDGWSVQGDPSGQGGLRGGRVTDADRDMLPRFDQCATADGPPQSAPLHWDAFRQLDLATQVTGTPRPGERPSHHLVFVQEYVLTDTPSAVTSTFADLEDAMAACVGQQATSDDGEQITSAPLEVPAVGDAATGLRYTVTEPGGRGGPVWDLRNVAFRDGDLVVALTVVEIASPTIERVLDDAAFTRIVRAAHDATS